MSPGSSLLYLFDLLLPVEVQFPAVKHKWESNSILKQYFMHCAILTVKFLSILLPRIKKKRREGGISAALALIEDTECSGQAAF